MNDVRIRIGTATILSLTAFLNTGGAVAVIVWWVLFTPRQKTFPRSSVIAGSVSMVGIIAIVLQIVDGTGFSYGIRMGAILLIAMWVWSEHHSGEFLHLGVWLFGKQRGFELGLIAELAMQAFDALLSDLDRLKTAWTLKGMHLNTTLIATAGIVLVKGALVRARDTSEILAVRGYRQGGTLCPAFNPVPADIMGCIAAIVVGSFAILSVGEFFILPW